MCSSIISQYTKFLLLITYLYYYSILRWYRVLLCWSLSCSSETAAQLEAAPPHFTIMSFFFGDPLDLPSHLLAKAKDEIGELSGEFRRAKLSELRHRITSSLPEADRPEDLTDANLNSFGAASTIWTEPSRVSRRCNGSTRGMAMSFATSALQKKRRRLSCPSRTF